MEEDPPEVAALKPEAVALKERGRELGREEVTPPPPFPPVLTLTPSVESPPDR